MVGTWRDGCSICSRWSPKRSCWVRGLEVQFIICSYSYDVTFIHPKGNAELPIGGAGVLIELVQAPEDVIKALK